MFKKSIILLVLLLAIQIPTTKEANAQVTCDVCTAGAVIYMTTVVTGVLAEIAFELNEIGKGVQQIVEGNASGFASINQTLVEIARIQVNEAHLLEEKIATLAIKRDINDKFGSVSEDLCYEVEETSGNIAGNVAIENAVRDNVNNFVAEYRATTRGTGRRSAILSEIPDTIVPSNYLSGEILATDEMLEHLPKVVVALTESKEYEAPRIPTTFSPLSNTEKEYTQQYRSRQFAMQIVQDSLRSTIQDQSIPTKPAGEWVATKLEDAGLSPGGYVEGSMSTKAGIIQAIGHSQFGSNGAKEVSQLSGDELLKKQVQMLGQSNYLMAETWKVLTQQKLLTAMELSKVAEEHYYEDMVRALGNVEK